MLDKKTVAVLKALNKLSEGNTYKVITSEEIVAMLANKSQFDSDVIKQIIEFLEKQEYINIKFCEENTYCYSLLPKARICLEQEFGKGKRKRGELKILPYVFTCLSAFVGSLIAMFVFFYLAF